MGRHSKHRHNNPRFRPRYNYYESYAYVIASYKEECLYNYIDLTYQCELPKLHDFSIDILYGVIQNDEMPLFDIIKDKLAHTQWWMYVRLFNSVTTRFLNYFNKYRSKETCDMLINLNAKRSILTQAIDKYGNNNAWLHSKATRSTDFLILLVVSVFRDYIHNGDLTFIREKFTPMDYVLRIFESKIKALRNEYSEINDIIDECVVSYILESGEEITLTPELCNDMIRWTQTCKINMWSYDRRDGDKLMNDVKQFKNIVDRQETHRRDGMRFKAKMLGRRNSEIINKSISDEQDSQYRITPPKGYIFNLLTEEKNMRNASIACETRRLAAHDLYDKLGSHLQFGLDREQNRVKEEYEIILRKPKMAKQVRLQELRNEIPKLVADMQLLKTIFEQYASTHECYFTGHYSIDDIKKCYAASVASPERDAAFTQYIKHLHKSITPCDINKMIRLL